MCGNGSQVRHHTPPLFLKHSLIGDYTPVRHMAYYNHHSIVRQTAQAYTIERKIFYIIREHMFSRILLEDEKV